MDLEIYSAMLIETHGVPFEIWLITAILALIFFIYGIHSIRDKTFPAAISFLMATTTGFVTGTTSQIVYMAENLIAFNETQAIVVPTITLVNYAYLGYIFYGIASISLILTLYCVLKSIGLVGVSS